MSNLIYIGGYANQSPCTSCKYAARPNESVYCDYLLKTGHSRTIGEDGKPRLPKRYCDKFEEMKQK